MTCAHTLVAFGGWCYECEHVREEPPRRIARNMTTPESRAFWNATEKRVAEDDFRDTYGCTTVTRWRIEFALMWAVIASMMPAPKQATRWSMLEVDP